MPLDAEGKPIEPVKVDVPCPKCGGPMGLKQGRRGGFLGCLKYPKCRGTSPLPEDMKDAVPAAAARPSASADLKAIQVAQTCDQCGSAMIVRRGKRGYFLGCSKYPKCRGTKEPDADTLAKIEAVTSQATAESSEPAE